MRKIILAITIVLVGISNVNAICTKPLGSYSGLFSVDVYNTSTGYITDSFSSIVTITFASNGSATATEIGKRWGNSGTGRYTATWTVPAIGTATHTFNTTNCRGTATSNLNRTWVYTSTSSGTKITGAYYGNDSVFYTNNFILDKL